MTASGRPDPGPTDAVFHAVTATTTATERAASTRATPSPRAIIGR